MRNAGIQPVKALPDKSMENFQNLCDDMKAHRITGPKGFAMRAVYIAAIAFLIAGNANSQNVKASNTVGINLAGIVLGLDWKVFDDGTIEESFNTVISQKVLWNGSLGGCQDPFLGPWPLGALVVPINYWTAVCASGFQCVSGRKLLQVQSSIYTAPIGASLITKFTPIGEKNEIQRFIDVTIDAGQCP